MMHSNKSEQKPRLKEFSFEAIGTHWRIEYSRPSDDLEIEQVILDRIELFDKVYSRFRHDSVITAMSQQPGRYELPTDAAPLFDFYDQLYNATAGLVTPLIGSTLSDAGYDMQYSLTFKQKTVAPDPGSVMTRDGNTITILRPALIDIGAAGKGYLVDIICDLLKNNDATSAVIDAGGDIAVFSNENQVFDIALQHPGDNTLAIGVASFASGSICGSSIHLRSWGSHHHIINPVTAVSPVDVQATWVYADTAMVADGISTALFFTNPDKLKRQFAFEYAIMRADDSLQYSPGFPASLFE